MIDRKLLRQLLVFGAVGVVATATHYLVALGCHEALLVNLYAANLAGYGAAVAVSYVGHGKFTFQAELNRSVLRRFVLVSLAAFFASEGLLAALETRLQLPHRVSLAVVVMIIPAISFVLNKLWVYRETHASHPDIEAVQAPARDRF
ncbi:MAG TPA: GtrA family protein [Gammaproteobacteria bacterium]